MKPKMLIVLAVVLVVVTTIVTIVRNREFLYAGTVEATEVDLSARLNAVIDSLAVREGDAVKRGDVLAHLSGDDVRVAAEAAARDYKRAVALLEAGSMNQGDFDKLKYRYEDSQVRLSWCTITSPINGTVLTRYHEPGEMVNPGAKLLTLADLSVVWAYVYVPQPMLARLQVGMPVDAFVPESGMKKITGKIIKINNEAEFTPRNVQTRKERTRLVFGIKLEFQNTDNFLKPGMTIEAKLPKE